MSQREIVSRDIAEAAKAIPMTEPTARERAEVVTRRFSIAGLVPGSRTAEDVTTAIEQAILAAEQRAREKALIEAANLCAGRALNYDDAYSKGAEEALECEFAIRALATPPATEEAK